MKTLQQENDPERLYMDVTLKLDASTARIVPGVNIPSVDLSLSFLRLKAGLFFTANDRSMA